MLVENSHNFDASRRRILTALTDWQAGIFLTYSLQISAVMVLLVLSGIAQGSTVLDFEGFPDGAILTTQYRGLTFTNSVILTAGIGLNEFEFPPHSGANVVSDNGGPMSIAFSTPILSFSGYFTYLEPLTVAAFDASSTQVGSTTSAFSSNLALSGDPGSSPNEFLQVALAAGISSVTITGDPLGGSFVLDDASFTSPVPEPAHLNLALPLIILIVWRTKHRPRSAANLK